MRRDISRYFRLSGVALLLALLLLSGCTRSKSAGPPTATAGQTSAPAATQPPADEPSPTPGLSGQDALAVTRTALAREAAVVSPSPQPTQAAPPDTPEATESPEPTATTAAEAPEPTQSPGPTQAPEPTQEAEPTAQPPSTEVRIHTVQLNETLFRIALRYGLDAGELAAFNGIANPNFIFPGQEIRIPPGGEVITPPVQAPGFHIVQQDENLFRIALRYEMLFTTLAEANGLTFPYAIYVGQRLIIP